MADLYQRDDWQQLQAHPAAEVFPLMSDSELSGMVEDMKERGFDRNHPVALKDGLVLDGRNRLRACGLTGVTPWFFDYESNEATAYVVRANLHRRHLTPSQNALVAAKLRDDYEGEARAAQSKAGREHGRGQEKLGANSRQAISKESRYERKATTQLAREFGLGGRIVEDAARLMRDAPDLFKEVEEGKRTVNAAVRVLKKRGEMETVSEKPKRRGKPKHPRERSLEAYEAIVEGKMEAFLDVAHALLQIRERSLHLHVAGEFKRYLRDRWGISFGQRFREATCGVDAVLLCEQKEQGEQ